VAGETRTTERLPNRVQNFLNEIGADVVFVAHLARDR
jgi:hypothetical protein